MAENQAPSKQKGTEGLSFGTPPARCATWKNFTMCPRVPLLPLSENIKPLRWECGGGYMTWPCRAPRTHDICCGGGMISVPQGSTVGTGRLPQHGSPRPPKNLICASPVCSLCRDLTPLIDQCVSCRSARRPGPHACAAHITQLTFALGRLQMCQTDIKSSRGDDLPPSNPLHLSHPLSEALNPHELRARAQTLARTRKNPPVLLLS